MTADPYNKFCVDCHRGQSTHACLTFGIFVCGPCAQVHQAAFGGRSRSQVKDVFGEHWDDLQLETIAFGGNKAFYTFLQEYEGIASWPIEKKYKSDQANWYARRLAAHLDQRAFTEKQPAKDWDERFERAKQSMKNIVSSLKSDAAPKTEAPKAEAKEETKAEAKAEPKPDSKAEVKIKEWNSKIKGFFKEKFAKPSKPADKPPADKPPSEEPKPEEPKPEAKPETETKPATEAEAEPKKEEPKVEEETHGEPPAKKEE